MCHFQYYWLSYMYMNTFLYFLARASELATSLLCRPLIDFFVRDVYMRTQ
jgi:hypothetical protein